MTLPEDSPADYRHPIAEDEVPSRAVFLAVGAATDRDPLDLAPLGRTIDADSLDALLGTSPDADDLQVTFDYAGCTVTVSHSTVRVDIL